jgi:hypothetical protein
MGREGDSTFGVDLFTDVLVRDDATSYVITGQPDLEDMLERAAVRQAADDPARAIPLATCGPPLTQLPRAEQLVGVR